MADILLVGGARDPNLPWLKAAADRLGLSSQCLFFDETQAPRLDWNLETGEATLDGVPIDCRAAFMRYDVFSQLTTGRPAAAASAAAWFAAITGLCAATGIITLNRDIDPVSSNKPAMLLLARQAGLRIPPTLLTNDSERAHAFVGSSSAIAKPVAGGSYIMRFDEAARATDWQAGASPSPAIVQPQLAYPERRIYRIGTRFFVCDIASQTLDSRLDGNMRIAAMPLTTLPSDVLDGLQQLTDRLRCDFCAVDMKTDPTTGELVFLELNNGPMFMAYDQAADGAMSEEMLRYLIGRGVAAEHRHSAPLAGSTAR